MNKILFTIGHSTHSVEHFVSLLRKHLVQAVCDVRSVPYSQHNPQFNREPLNEFLLAEGIRYVFLGKRLGGRTSNPACYIDGKVQYNYVVDEPQFRFGLRDLLQGINKHRVALMCAEGDPLTCHRTILICRELRAANLQIEHILPDGSLEANYAAERRLLSMLNIHPDMLSDEQTCIERAYDMQANNIAYTVQLKDGKPKRAERRDENLHDRIYE